MSTPTCGIRAAIIVLIFVGIFVSELSYRKGLDPDDVTSPTIGAMGDIITVICLFLTVRLIVGMGI